MVMYSKFLNREPVHIIITENTYYTIPQLLYVIHFFIWSCDTAIPKLFIGEMQHEKHD